MDGGVLKDLKHGVLGLIPNAVHGAIFFDVAGRIGVVVSEAGIDLHRPVGGFDDIKKRDGCWITGKSVAAMGSTYGTGDSVFDKASEYFGQEVLRNAFVGGNLAKTDDASFGDLCHEDSGAQGVIDTTTDLK